MKVLSVDDNPQNRKLLERALQAKFEVISSDGNEPIIELMQAHDPEVVLMDIMLENGLTGYDLVTDIRAHPSFADTEIIFISALTSSEDKLNAYGCGGDDYISKPVDFSILHEKLRRVEYRIAERESLKEQCDMASNTAFTSMQQANELGALVTFFTSNLDVHDMDILFQNIREYFANSGVSCCVEFRVSGQHFQYPAQSMTDLEKEILELGRKAKRIVPFGANMLFNSPFCSMLVKGLPIYDDDLLGRVRDNFAILLTIVDSRIEAIQEQQERDNIRKQAISELKKQLLGDFAAIKKLCENQDEKVSALVSNLSQSIQLKIITLGLDEDQESELVGLVDDTKDDVEETLGISFIIEDKLQNITEQLKAID
ncbi:response regulator [Pseudoalteromonas sp. T1lg65]|uniref:response regulator n=1 Tax=Pseudoalteromonas sp. T1lg65 TaxID=2077101 RepID=UPI003F795288